MTATMSSAASGTSGLRKRRLNNDGNCRHCKCRADPGSLAHGDAGARGALYGRTSRVPGPFGCGLSVSFVSQQGCSARRCAIPARAAPEHAVWPPHHRPAMSAGLHDGDAVAAASQLLIDGAPARAVGEGAMHQHHVPDCQVLLSGLSGRSGRQSDRGGGSGKDVKEIADYGSSPFCRCWDQSASDRRTARPLRARCE